MSSNTGEPGGKLVLPTESLIHTIEPTKTTPASDAKKSVQRLVLPTEALIHTVEPTTTTTTTKAVAFRPRRQSRKRSNSRDALSALTSPMMSTSSSLYKEDHVLPTRSLKAEHNVVKTEGSGYEAFPSFESWVPRSRFSLTRSLSLRSPLVSQPNRRRVLRALTTASLAPAHREAQPRSLESEAERVAWLVEELPRAHVCMWAGPWRRRSSGEFICPCGEHRLGADSKSVKNLEDKMRGLARGGTLKQGK